MEVKETLTWCSNEEVTLGNTSHPLESLPSPASRIDIDNLSYPTLPASLLLFHSCTRIPLGIIRAIPRTKCLHVADLFISAQNS